MAVLCAVLCLVAQSCPTLHDPMDCSPPGFSVRGGSPGKNTGVFSSMGSSWPRNQTRVSCIAGKFFTSWATREAHICGPVQFSSVTQSCPTLCGPMNRSTPGLPLHHQLPEFTQTHVHRVSNAIQPSHPLLSPSPPDPIPPSIRVFSNESTLRMRWPKYWTFIIPSKEIPRLISFRMDWLDLLAVQQSNDWKRIIEMPILTKALFSSPEAEKIALLGSFWTEDLLYEAQISLGMLAK